MLIRQRRAWVLLATAAAVGNLAFPGASRALAGPRGPGWSKTSTAYTYVVDSTADDFDKTAGDFMCKTNAGTCTLRAAIQQANFNCGGRPGDATTTTIDFAIGSGPKTITTGSFGLPGLGCPVVLDGTSQPGYAGTPIIEVSGAATPPNNVGGISISTSCSCPSSIRGLVINRFMGPGIGLGHGGPFTVQNNFIGTDRTGTIALGNGVGIGTDRGSGAIIGGTTAAARNLISGNAHYGVVLQMSMPNNVVAGNYIGTDVTGTKAVGNGSDGVSVNSTGDVIGGSAPGAGNVISANRGNGIAIFGNPVGNTVVQRNRIGTQVDGKAPLGNALNGIAVENTGPDTIGGMTKPLGNRIAFNGHDGIVVMNGTGHALLANSIFGNGTLGLKDSIGIDLTGCGTCIGVTPNDTNDGDIGPNNRQNFPVLTSAVATPSTTTVSGTLNSTANTTFLLLFFASPTCDPSRYGEGKHFLGSASVKTVGNNVTFTVHLPAPVGHGQVVTSTATDPGGNTSEFSKCRTVP
jgi:CSLREA domain-containing protein